MKSQLLLNRLAFLFAAMALCLSYDAHAFTTNVTYGAFFFSPNDVTIHVGDTVFWTNGPVGHTLLGTGADAICGGSSLPCSHTFTTAGDFPYQCTQPGHASFGMTGIVHVLSVPVTPALLTNAFMTNGNFVFTVQSTANHTNIVQGSVDISSSNNWTSLGTNIPAGGTFIFTDSNANLAPIKFYRVVQP